jgi:hypothetical protein
MMNSDTRKEPDIILDEIFELIDESYMQQTIDKPIEEAAASFKFDDTAPVTHLAFIQITSKFVKHIYEHGAVIRQQLSTLQACTEMTAILEKGYQNPSDSGYYAAYLDSISQKINSLEFVLAKVAEFITMMTRARHIRWVFTSRIDPYDWSAKCRIVRILFKRWGNCLPPNILECPPDQLANFLPELINLIISTENTVNKMQYANIDFAPI